MVDIQEIERLIALMKSSGVLELSVQSGDFKVSLRRAEDDAHQSPAVRPAEGDDDAEIVTQVIESANSQATTSFTTPVISPLVGVFHNGGAPEHRSLLKQGDRVKEGQVIAAIEALKVQNELRSPVAGIVGRVLVEDGSGVEYGQTLFLIEQLEQEHPLPVESIEFA